nr:hypothetical protein [Microbacterium sufflavum]
MAEDDAGRGRDRQGKGRTVGGAVPGDDRGVVGRGRQVLRGDEVVQPPEDDGRRPQCGEPRVRITLVQPGAGQLGHQDHSGALLHDLWHRQPRIREGTQRAHLGVVTRRVGQPLLDQPAPVALDQSHRPDRTLPHPAILAAPRRTAE